MVSETGEFRPEAFNISGKRILMVDDDKYLLEIYGKYLSSHGFVVDTFSDGLEALKCFIANIHDLVLTDIRMPGLTGIVIADYIREQNHQIPILALTGSPFSAVGPFDEVLTKPIDLDLLLESVLSYFPAHGQEQ